MISVFLVSDFELLKNALQSLLYARRERFRLSGNASTLSAEAPPWTGEAPDVVLLDPDIKQGNVIPWIGQWSERIPAKILLLGLRDESSLAEKAMLAGARGLLNCRESFNLLPDAIEKIHMGEVWLDHKTTGRLWSHLTARHPEDPLGSRLGLALPLTPREQRILTYVIKLSGDPARTIAKKLNMSESTLRNHLTSIYNKCGVANRSGLLAFAVKHGLAEQLGPD